MAVVAYVEREGTITIEMQFMADVSWFVACHGERFKKEILEVKFEGKSISDVLNLTIDEAIDFFATHQQNKIVEKLKPLQDVGLGYVKLGQSSNTLSGGEACEVGFFLWRKGETTNKTLLFDEPSTGLHFQDIQKLIKALRALIDLGHSGL